MVGQEIVFGKKKIEQIEDNFDAHLVSTYNQMVFDVANKIRNGKTWGMGPSSVFLNRILKFKDSQGKKNEDNRLASIEFTLDNRNYQAKYNFPSDKAKHKFEKIMSNIKDHQSAYLTKFNFKDSEDNNTARLMKIFIEYIVENEEGIRKDLDDNGQNSYDNDLTKKNSVLNVSHIDTMTKSALINWENDYILNLKLPDDISEDMKIGNKSMVLPSYHDLFMAISDDYVFLFGVSPVNKHYIDERVKDINIVPTLSISIYKTSDMFIEVQKNFHLCKDKFRNLLQFEYASDLNKNIENSLGEAAEIARYWYTEAVQNILRRSKLEKSNDMEYFVRLIVEEVLAANIEGVDTLETYPFDRVFIFDRAIDKLLEEENNESQDEAVSVSVSEALIESKISITDNYIKKKKPKNSLEGIVENNNKQYLYEWHKNQKGLDLEMHELDYNKKIIKEALHIPLPIHKDDVVFNEDFHASTEIVINNLLYILMFGDKLDENDPARQAILEYKAKYFKNDFLYLYSTGVDLPNEINVLNSLQKKYYEFNDKRALEEVAAENEFIKKKQEYLDHDQLKNCKVILVSYSPSTSNDGFTMVIVANEDFVKTTTELNSERDDLQTALELIVRQQFVLQKEYDERAKKQQDDTISNLQQAKHSLLNYISELPSSLKNEEPIKQLEGKITDVLSNNIEKLGEASTEIADFTYEKFEHPLDRSRAIIQKLLDKNPKFNFEKTDLPYDYFAKQLLEIKHEDKRIHNFTFSQADKHIELTIDLNEIEPFVMTWSDAILYDLFHVMLKNSCEAAMGYLNVNNTSNIFIDIFISRTESGRDTLNIEFTNNTIEPISKKRLDLINTASDTIEKNSTKSSSNGIGIGTARARLNYAYNDEGEDLAGIHFTLLSKNKIKSKLYLPIEVQVDDNIFAPEPEELHVEHQKDVPLFYLEDESEYYEKNIQLFESLNIPFMHKRSYQEYADALGNQNILITDLNVYGNNSYSKVNYEYGLDAIADFVENSGKTVIVLSSDYRSAKDGLSDILETLKVEKNIEYKVYDDEKYDTLEENSIYIFETKTIKKDEHTNIINLLSRHVEKNETTQNTNSFNTNKFQIEKLENIHQITEFQKEQVEDTVFLLDMTQAKDTTVLKNIMEIWTRHKVTVNKRKYLISSPVRFDSTKLMIKVNRDCCFPQVRHDSLKQNIIFLSTEDMDKELNKVFELEINSNGVFAPIRHDIKKIKPFGDVTQDQLDFIEKECTRLEELFESDYEKFLDNKKPMNVSNDLKTFQNRLSTIISESEKNGEHLGQSREIIQKQLERFNYYYDLCGENNAAE